MPDPVNAADVLHGQPNGWRMDMDKAIDALLAYGDGDPVVITDDRRLGRKTCGCPVDDPVRP